MCLLIFAAIKNYLDQIYTHPVALIECVAFILACKELGIPQ